MTAMTNGRKAKRRRGTGRRASTRQLVGERGAEESTRSGTLHMVRSGSIVHGTPAAGSELPAIPESAAKSIHVVIVSLHGAVPPPWRRLELPSAMTLDRLHVVLSETFGWSDFGQHSFVTIYGEFGDPMWRAARHAPDVLVEKVLAAEPGAGYPCWTGGQGADVPGEEYVAVGLEPAEGRRRRKVAGLGP